MLQQEFFREGIVLKGLWELVTHWLTQSDTFHSTMIMVFVQRVKEFSATGIYPKRQYSYEDPAPKRCSHFGLRCTVPYKQIWPKSWNNISVWIYFMVFYAVASFWVEISLLCSHGGKQCYIKYAKVLRGCMLYSLYIYIFLWYSIRKLITFAATFHNFEVDAWYKFDNKLCKSYINNHSWPCPQGEDPWSPG